jgi:hypothetical protein
VEGNIYLDHPYSFKKGDYKYEFHLDSDNKLEEIAIMINIPYKNIEKFKSDISEKNGMPHIKLGADIEIENRIKDEFKLLESNLSFICKGILKKIHWDKAKEEFIPQEDKEKKYIKVFSFKTTKKYLDPKATIKKDVLKHYVKNGSRYAEFAILKAFWREGINYFKKFQYVQAFYNYYFIIEGLYANGKTSQKAVLKEFSKSTELSKICEETLDKFKKDQRHGKKLIEMMNEENCAYNRSGLQNFLFKMRGRLHHFSQKSSILVSTPFNQKEFESAAFICGYIACLAIGYSEVQLNKENNI